MSNPEDFLDPNQRVSEAEDMQIMCMLTAMYVHYKHPEMTIQEVYTALEDVEFIKKQIREVVEELNGNSD
jgi:methyl coenzyme M reductase gamma subunit